MAKKKTAKPARAKATAKRPATRKAGVKLTVVKKPKDRVPRASWARTCATAS